MKTPEKLTLNSPELQSQSPISGNLAKLQLLFPSVVREGKVDFDALRQLLGDDVAKEDELFGLQWHGKARARRNALTPSLGTLRPCKEESKNWDSTKNLYIEGDNLEVLKLLQKSYAGKVKMIYIDPPYNTGNEFVYPDDYQNGIQNYLNLTGQQDKFKANAETSGRYHTDWLNMMYPRLMLARELLSDDGVIFISIDDHEISNLLQICSEIFGFVNHLGVYLKQSKVGGGSDSKFIVKEHEYCVVFAKNSITAEEMFIEHDANYLHRYKESDGKGRFFWDTFARPGLKNPIYYDIVAPDGAILHNGWIHSKDRFDEEKNNGEIKFIKKKDNSWSVQFKQYLNESGKKPRSLTSDFGGTIEGKKELGEILQCDKLFSYPKSCKFISQLAKTVSTKNDFIILDFFSGSATTAHAVMQLNAEDGGNRQFIMVQLPEPCVEGSEAEKAGYANICEIGKERIRRAGEKVKEEAGLAGQTLDIGFRVFKLDTSNVMPWSTEPGQLNLQLENESNLRPERTSEDIFYEVLLKQGIELTEDSRSKEITGHTVYSLGYGLYYCCFDSHIGMEAQELAAGIARWHEEEDPDGKDCVVYVRDSAFDSSNTMQGVNGDEGDARKKSFCQTLEQSGILKVKAF
ncbi:MAG: site-specific DNA-methyltransferase [Akkermansia sp.]|nr:site-specific DNA-methyltransferase [Akkermansia sp.]